MWNEGTVVQQMYFIIKGEVGVGFKYFQDNHITQGRFKITHIYEQGNYIGDQYVLWNKRARFHY